MRPCSFHRNLTVLRTVAVAGFLAAAMARAADAQVEQVADTAFHPVVADPAFTARHPRILFDEAHDNFHRMNGRYAAYRDLMLADGCTMAANVEPFSRATLDGHDVLVIANALGGPTDSTAALPAFSPEEIEAVHAWVTDGGALLLIADHAPFGEAAAALGARFGVDMSRGYTGDSLQAAGPGGATNIAFTRERGTLGSHPILEGRSEKERIDKVVAFTGQSLLGPAGAAPLLLLSDGSFDIPPEALARRDDPAAMMAQSKPARGRSMIVAFEVGRGRVIVQGEAAMLSAQLIRRPGVEPYKFGMNQEGLDNVQFALNEMRWLVGRQE